MKKNGRVVLLTAKPETIYERVKDSDERPILNDHMNVEFISSLMDKRKERYEAVADITVATDGKNVTQICEEIISKLIALDNAKEEQEKKQIAENSFCQFESGDKREWNMMHKYLRMKANKKARNVWMALFIDPFTVVHVRYGKGITYVALLCNVYGGLLDPVFCLE